MTCTLCGSDEHATAYCPWRFPRYVVHDADGPLRAFHSRREADAWRGEGMRVVVKPRAPKVEVWRSVGDALL